MQAEYKDYYNGVFSLENDNPHTSYADDFEAFLDKFENRDEILKV